MGLFDRFKRKPLWTDISPGERRLLELLTDGNIPELERLRAQWGEPFWLGVDRETYPDRYEVALVYDRSAVDRHSIGEHVNFPIDDLFVTDRRIGVPLPCVGHVSNGILTNLIVTASQPTRWPKGFNVDDWHYLGVDGAKGRARTVDWSARLAAARALPARLDPAVEAAIPADYRDYMSRKDRRFDAHDASLLRLSQLYFLDDDRVPGRLLVFASTADASIFAFAGPDRPPAGGVYFVDVSDGSAELVADSFSEWLAQAPKMEED